MKVCPNCHTSFYEFSESGLFGCENCYLIFKEEIVDFLKKEHGKAFHVGKTPNGKPYSENLAEAYLKLLKEKSALEREGKFEKLSDLKEKIRLLEEAIYERGLK